MTQGPSATQLYYGAASGSSKPDTGRAFGTFLRESELNARQHHAAPTVPPETDLPVPQAFTAGHQPHEWYNYDGSLPVKYDVPTAQKERMQMRQEVRKAAALEQRNEDAGKVIRTDPITEDEVDYLQSMKDQAELADFDRYVNKLIDPRKPGNLKWLMEIYPEFVNRRIQQVHTDYEFALRNQMIDSWGINTFDDLIYKYQVDQGKIDGPRLATHRQLSDWYAPGLLSPWAFMAGNDLRAGSNLKLPYASAKIGRRPANDNKENWSTLEIDQPLSKGRSTTALAQSMYARPPQRGGVYPRVKPEY